MMLDFGGHIGGCRPPDCWGGAPLSLVAAATNKGGTSGEREGRLSVGGGRPWGARGGPGLVKVDLELLDAAWGALLGARQILEGGDGLHAAQVDDQQMGGLSRALRLPVGRLLQVEDLVAQVVAVLFLRVGILRLPGFARESLAVLALQIELGDGGAVAVLLGAEALDGEVAALLQGR